MKVYRVISPEHGEGIVLCSDFAEFENYLEGLRDVLKVGEEARFHELSRFYRDLRGEIGEWCYMMPSFVRLLSSLLSDALEGKPVAFKVSVDTVDVDDVPCFEFPSPEEGYEFIENEWGEPCVIINGRTYCLHDVRYCSIPLRSLLEARLISLILKTI